MIKRFLANSCNKSKEHDHIFAKKIGFLTNSFREEEYKITRHKLDATWRLASTYYKEFSANYF